MIVIKSAARPNNDRIEKKNNSETLVDSKEVPFRSLLIFLSIVGGLPLTWRKPHYPSLHPIKSTFIIAILIHLEMLVIVKTVVQFYSNHLLKVKLLQEQMLHVEVFILCSFVVIPMSVWSDVPTIRRGVNIWNQLEEAFYKVTKKRLKRWKKLEKIIIVFTLIFPSTVYVIAKESNPEIEAKYEYGPPCVQGVTIWFLVCCLWIGYFANITAAAKDISNELSQDIKQNMVTLEKLRGYREIWIRMRALSDLLSSLNAPVVIFILSNISSIVFIFEFIIFLKAGKYLAAFPQLLVFLAVLLLLTFMARASHIAVEEMKILFSGILAQQKLSSMREGSQRQVVNLYLVEKMRSAIPNFSGFMVVNKALISSIFGAISTYLVMLAQLTQPATVEFPNDTNETNEF